MLFMCKGLIWINFHNGLQELIFFFSMYNFQKLFLKGKKKIKAGRFCVGILLPPAKRSTDFMIFGILFTCPVSLGLFFLHCESSN